jgi:hypothetical protein
MKTYLFSFTGRRKGAIGSYGQFSVELFAESLEAGNLALYDHFQDIGQIQAKEITSPFDADTLVLHAQNDANDHKAIRYHVERLRKCIETVAERHAKACADWHDDPDSADHLLYHAGAEKQFPQALRDAAILELVSRHLDVITENETERAK